MQETRSMTRRMLRVKQVCAQGGFSRSTLYNKIKAGDFPAPIEIGPNAVGWPAHEIDAWVASRPRRTYGSEG
ncbi:MAG: AlpA family transcriptional regulator, partial [Rhodospirillaceae bacterium]|nr:AlpA family transcriptional regulator [Rhodospirillaceae bacterium]